MQPLSLVHMSLQPQPIISPNIHIEHQSNVEKIDSTLKHSTRDQSHLKGSSGHQPVMLNVQLLQLPLVE